MKTITRVVILVACLLAAIGCYAFGISAGGAIFLVAGLIFEGLFGFGIFGMRKSSMCHVLREMIIVK